MATEDVAEEECERWRDACRTGSSPFELAVESGVTRRTVIDHVSGECPHDGGYDPVLSSYSVSAEECRALRRQFESGHEIDELLETSARGWRTIVNHLIGECSHPDSTGAPTVSKDTVYRRDRISGEDCERFRRGVQDAGSVMEFSNTVDTDYQVILAHVNGECSHETETPPRETAERRGDVSGEECRAIRETYRSDPAMEYPEIAEDYDCSPTTIERHVQFRCSHPPVDALVTDVAAVEDILSDSTGPARPGREVDPAGIVELDAVARGDVDEASPDLAEPDSDRVDTTRSRIVRNTELTHDIKSMYDQRCQVCGDRRRGPGGAPYAEAHYLRPLGEPHVGPDSPDNIIVLCPNHHADFDYGQITIDPVTHRISHRYDDEIDGTELSVKEPHDVSESHLRYHNEVVGVSTEG